jgi:lipid II:glycine glycyltransferase (peptidoglycan interpeptide bridge formation enzyme)
MNLIELSKEEFIEFSKNYPYSLFFQSPYWIEIKKFNNWNGTMIGMKKENKIIAATVILTKNIKGINKKMAYAPRGFLLDYQDEKLLEKFTQEIKGYCKKNNILFLKINPYIKYQEHDIDGNIIENTKNDKLIQKLTELGYIHQGFYITMDEKKDLEPRWLSVLELENKTTDEILKEMRTTTRWSIRNSEKNCLRVIECSRDDLKEFKLLMKHTAERREFIDRPLSYYQNMYDVLSKEDLIKVLLVEINFKELLEKTTKEKEELLEKIERSKDNPKKQNQLKELTQELTSFDKRIESLLEYQKKYGDTKIIAGGLYMLYGRQLVYLLGASYKEFMKYNSQYLLQWQMINYAKEHNYQTFNFYGIDGDFSKESKNYGLFDFKRGFSACVVELIGEFDLVINKPLYHLYKLAFKTYKILKNIKNHIKK